MDDRLKQIEKRTKALGWHFINDNFTFTLLKSCQQHIFNKPGKCPAGGMWLTMGTKGYEAAERLLTAYEPVTGPVVVIGDEDCHNCQLDTGDQACNFPCKELSPGTYRLTRCATRRIVMSDQHDWIFTCPFCKKDTRTNANPDIPGSVLCYHCNKKLMVMDLEKRPVPTPAPYPLEQYAKAAEDLGNQPITPYEEGNLWEYVEAVNWERGWRSAAKTFADMLRGTPMSLWVKWPAYFPDPDPGAGDKETVTRPVVVIRRATDASGDFCNTNCDLSSRTLCLHCSGHVISGPHRPKETCPGPAPVGKEWRMVLCDAPDPGAGDKGDGE